VGSSSWVSSTHPSLLQVLFCNSTVHHPLELLVQLLPWVGTFVSEWKQHIQFKMLLLGILLNLRDEEYNSLLLIAPSLRALEANRLDCVPQSAIFVGQFTSLAEWKYQPGSHVHSWNRSKERLDLILCIAFAISSR